ncbi:MAG: hypothetical protein VYA53_05125 [Acidobacteriota bacterium]|nr:hypothetical protein [Acidobacteriota bacterium]
MIGNHRTTIIASHFVVVIVVMMTVGLSKGPEMEPEELVTRHLNAIGDTETREGIQSRIVRGVGRFEVVVGGAGQLEGAASILSQGNKLRLSIDFNHLNYSAERITFDGEECYVGNIEPGVRSQLGNFFYQYDDLIKEGLLGGVLSTAWPLANIEDRGPKLDYRGLKKINDLELLELRYRMKKGGRDFTINLYFDPQTFYHIASIYKLRISARMGRSPEASARQRETRLTLEEWFDDFQTRQGLELPSRWTIRFTIEGNRGTSVAKWDMAFDRALHNMSINPQLFVLE